nr:MAG TPA: rough colony protein B [Caudoviricetes sp.]DAN61417.1 MAG TPA: rough colony protein B [Caudoviricetes sp.]
MKKAFLFISTAFLLSSCAAVKSPVTGYVYQETQSPYNI